MASRLSRLSRTDAPPHGLSARERVARCKDMPFHLSHRILRQPGDDSDHLGDLEVSKTFATEDPQSLGFGLRLQRSEEHTSELQSLAYLVCRLLLEKKKQRIM